jgi:NitT/TauT family transport system permease protein
VIRRLRDWAPVLLVFAAGLLLWQFVFAPWLGKFLLPTPWEIAKSLKEHWGVLWHAGWFTLQEAIGGFVVGSSLAILVALALARYKKLSGALMPYAIAANAVPIIAFAPITNAWFGLLNPHSKMAIAAVLCFFPVMVNSVRGLTSVQPAAIELMRSYAASEFEVFRRVRFPTALPFIFTGLKVAAVLSMIGAIVGEYFGGSIEALGVQIENSVTLFDLPLAWAAIVVASVLGIGFYALIGVVERFTIGWQTESRRAA